ncbi:MAG: single-stranded-DNA-specific exonuclease RecJ [Actinobacteria bacterium]|nr:single-stranded-DNA-specific exonuclease RecJ [Actinomycetota bacterium]MCL5883549.1 single-stranded-DNA-specific exonuclease RecJ [Actinomycetota bacterium]
MRSAGWYTSPLPYDIVRRLSRELGTSEITASVLARRGYTQTVDAARFLDSLGELHDPFLFPEMEAVCERIRKAVLNGEKICIHGDYDVDGVTSTALLAEVLRNLGAEVSCHLPNRFTEGYGIALSAIESIAAGGASLLITVDCGISARQQLEHARELGMKTIVIDHHRPVEGNLPPGPIISPLLCDYPFKELAGVGLAFKVAQALLERPVPGGDSPSETIADATSPASLHPDLRRLLDLVALGTIADVVPLIDENRALVKQGLVQLSRTGRPGLKALMQVGQVDPAHINAGLVAFRMAPRINAAGRLDEALPALELVLAEDEKTADELAARLDGFNRERQRIENKMLAEARAMIGSWPEEKQGQRGYVLSSAGWHEGVIGIVASRLVELYFRPVIMIAVDEESGRGKGSGRSVPDFDLHGSLLDLSGMLEGCGGHRAACGLSIDAASIEEFSQRFADYAGSRLSEEETRPSRFVDALVCGRELTLDLAQELSRLEPFGLGNPSVELLVTGARIQNDRATRDGQHLQCQVEAGGARSKAIGFGQAFMQEKLKSEPDWDIAFHLERNEFNGSISPQLQLREFFPRNGNAEPLEGLCEWRCDFDCPDRMTGPEFWGLLQNGLDIPAQWLPGSAGSSGGLAERLIDRRDFGGITAQIARLIAGGESVLMLVADVARRRRLITQELPVAAGRLRQAYMASSRCSSRILSERLRRLQSGEPSMMLADFATVTANPELAGHFKHLALVDPPWNRRVFDDITAAAPEAFVHLFYCSDEVQFTGKVLEHEYDLRGQSTRVYKHLETGIKYPLDETTERLLLAGGKYLRQPVMIARCIRILEELSLVSVEDGADGPMMSLLAAERTELDRSAVYKATQSFYRECSQFLSKSPSAKMV